MSIIKNIIRSTAHFNNCTVGTLPKMKGLLESRVRALLWFTAGCGMKCRLEND